MASQESTSARWHKNYTRLMPYYYVNKKAKLTDKTKENNSEERLVRVRKVIKSSKELIIEVAEKIDQTQNKEVKSKGKSKGNSRRKRLKESSLTCGWDELKEISYQAIKTDKWELTFIR